MIAVRLLPVTVTGALVRCRWAGGMPARARHEHQGRVLLLPEPVWALQMLAPAQMRPTSNG